MAAEAGGLLGYFLFEPFEAGLPYLMVVASSYFIYVADLIPQMQRRLPWKDTVQQVLWIGAGLGLMAIASFGHSQ